MGDRYVQVCLQIIGGGMKEEVGGSKREGMHPTATALLILVQNQLSCCS